MAEQQKQAPAERYSPERLKRFLDGEITAKDLHQLNSMQLLKMAMRGFQQYEQGRYPEAQAIFEMLVDVEPAEPYYRIALGSVFMAQEDLDRAEFCFNEAIRLKTTEVSAYVNRGEVFLRKGKVLEAAYDFKKAVELDPQGKDPLTQRARLLARAALDMLKKVKAGKKEEGSEAAPPKGAGKAAAPKAPAKSAPAAPKNAASAPPKAASKKK